MTALPIADVRLATEEPSMAVRARAMDLIG